MHVAHPLKLESEVSLQRDICAEQLILCEWPRNFRRLFYALHLRYVILESLVNDYWSVTFLPFITICPKLCWTKHFRSFFLINWSVSFPMTRRLRINSNWREYHCKLILITPFACPSSNPDITSVWGIREWMLLPSQQPDYHFVPKLTTSMLKN